MTQVSVVVIGYSPPQLLSRCLAALAAQMAAHPEAEVLIVAHESHQGESLRSVRAEYAAFHWVDTPPLHNVARMRGLGIARSRGEVIAFIEGDCIPAADWIERASRTQAGAVGGAVEPGDFRGGVDWAAYFCEFGKYMLPLPSTSAQLPGANVVYRRAALPAAERLESEGFYETFVNAGIGGALVNDSTLIVRHERRWRAGAALATRFHHGRTFAALRLRGRPLRERLPYIPLAMLLPLVLVARVLGECVKRRRLVGRGIATLPWIVALSLAWGAGELAGYAAGAGTSLERWR